MRRKLAPSARGSRKASPCPLDLASVDHVLTTTRSVRRRLDLDAAGRARGDRGVSAPRDPGADRRQLAGVALDRGHRRRSCGCSSPSSTATSRRRTSPRGSTTGEPSGAAAARRRLGEVPRRHPARGAGARDPVPVRRARGSCPSWAAAGAYGSILPAVWSFQLALRSRGLGSVFTTLHLPHADQAAELLGIPAGVTQAALDPGRLLHRRRLQARGAAADGGDHLLERVEADALTPRQRRRARWCRPRRAGSPCDPPMRRRTSRASVSASVQFASARRPSASSTLRMPIVGVPSRSNATDVASTVPSPSTRPGRLAARAGVDRALGLGRDRRRGSRPAGGSVE